MTSVVTRAEYDSKHCRSFAQGLCHWLCHCTDILPGQDQQKIDQSNSIGRSLVGPE